MRMIKWPSIEQFRNVVRNVQRKARYEGEDAEGNDIINNLASLPALRFEGTVKLHGTNASVVIDSNCDMWAQSRENIITPEKDNAGFAAFACSYERIFQDIATNATDHRKSTAMRDLAIFGEWCGGNIQKGVAICQLPKMFVIFGIAFVDADGNKDYLSKDSVINSLRELVRSPIWCIYDFATRELEIDFENPHESQNILNEITEFVEEECPVGKYFGVNGIGEGVVWRCVDTGYEDSGFWFKVKGEKHSKSKVRTLAVVDVERVNSIKELAERVANNGRLEQMHQQVFDTLNGGETDIKRMGEFIKAVMQDVFKEDGDVIKASGFNGKELSKPVFNICRKFIMQKLEV